MSVLIGLLFLGFASVLYSGFVFAGQIREKARRELRREAERIESRFGVLVSTVLVGRHLTVIVSVPVGFVLSDELYAEALKVAQTAFDGFSDGKYSSVIRSVTVQRGK